MIPELVDSIMVDNDFGEPDLVGGLTPQTIHQTGNSLIILGQPICKGTFQGPDIVQTSLVPGNRFEPSCLGSIDSLFHLIRQEESQGPLRGFALGISAARWWT